MKFWYILFRIENSFLLSSIENSLLGNKYSDISTWQLDAKDEVDEEIEKLNAAEVRKIV